jgi:uncharacterized RDD family membrane protein YckC
MSERPPGESVRSPEAHAGTAPASRGYTTTPPPGAGGPAVARPPGALEGRYVLAGWWSRVGAALIDFTIVGIGGVLLAIALMAPAGALWFADENVGIVAVVVGLLLTVVCVSLVALFYAPALMARTNGKTLGRMATGIRVVRASGQPISFGFALLREVVVKVLLFGFAATLTGGLSTLADVLWPLWDEENRALHDFVVDTRSVRD